MKVIRHIRDFNSNRKLNLQDKHAKCLYSFIYIFSPLTILNDFHNKSKYNDNHMYTFNLKGHKFPNGP